MNESDSASMCKGIKSKGIAPFCATVVGHGQPLWCAQEFSGCFVRLAERFIAYIVATGLCPCSVSVIWSILGPSSTNTGVHVLFLSLSFSSHLFLAMVVGRIFIFFLSISVPLLASVFLSFCFPSTPLLPFSPRPSLKNLISRSYLKYFKIFFRSSFFVLLYSWCCPYLFSSSFNSLPLIPLFLLTALSIVFVIPFLSQLFFLLLVSSPTFMYPFCNLSFFSFVLPILFFSSVFPLEPPFCTCLRLTGFRCLLSPSEHLMTLAYRHPSILFSIFFSLPFH